MAQNNTGLDDSQLERLPIPPLADTMQRYLDRLEPLQEEHKFQKTVAAVRASQEQLARLDRRLRQYDSELAVVEPATTYIEQFWYDAYLQTDESVVVNINPYFQLADDPTMQNISRGGLGEHSVQIKRASKLVVSILKFVRAIRRGSLSPDTVRGVRLSMDQYAKLFGSSRIPPGPGEDSCHLQTDPTSHHVVVMYQSQFYWFDVLDVNNEPIFQTPEELEWNLYSIIMDKDRESGARYPWGVFSTEGTAVWSDIRQHIATAEDHTNWNNLKIIDSALFVICLDDVEIEEGVEMAQSMLCGTSDIQFPTTLELKQNINHGIPSGVQRGTCLNRWYYKLQLIVTKNGKAGINFEHTGVDGHTVLRLARDIYTDSILNFAQGITKSVPAVFSSEPSPCPYRNGSPGANLITIPRRLEWKSDSYLLSSLHFAETRLSDMLSQFDFAVVDFRRYGANHIKTHFKTSPDAFMQMAFQTAYYALYGKFEMTYEPAMTKVFRNGRTEAIRTVSHASKTFVKSMFDNISTDKERMQQLQKACAHHSKISRECGAGQGQDRHLYALYCLWKNNLREEIPSIPLFEDAGWELLTTNVLSTSNCSNACLKSFGFGPVCANGFGIGYIIRGDSLSIVITSRHRQTRRLASLIERFLTELERIAQRASSEAGVRTEKSNDLKYLLSGYDYFDVSITG
ncbi:AaceriAER224Wp [[Ashbya] aceris (nom. inval.)]|nr:AaceriAER224Wp [[Ashbya] aceris (nom. inval.)]